MGEFIEYNGGTQPVGDNAKVDVKLRCGGDHIFKGYIGRTAPWFDKSNGVYAYRVVKPKLQIVKQKERE